MRPMINRLAAMATGKYLMKTDAHCSFDEGYDEKLIEMYRAGNTVLGVRYLLDTPTWKRRERTNCDFRYLSHPDHDDKGMGLRGTAWHELKDRFKGQKIAPTMTISGSGWLMLRKQFERWGGLDEENYGTFGQEGAEISLKTWLSGGDVLVNRNTWYAHWNRGKAPYALGQHQVRKSVDFSWDFWTNNRWEQQTHAFRWLIEKFAPVPGWTFDEAPIVEAPRQGTLRKGRVIRVQKLWDKWESISDRPKRYRLIILKEALADLYAKHEKGEGPTWKTHRYGRYLATHINKTQKGVDGLTPNGRKRVRDKFNDALDLYDNIKKKGLRAPLEFYQKDGRLVLWRGYRRLAVLQALGVKEVACVIHQTWRARRKMFASRKGMDLALPITRRAGDHFAELGAECTDKYWVHGYTEVYDSLFGAYLQRPVELLELGAKHGASLRLWHDVFPKGNIVGLDKDGEGWKRLAGDLDRVSVMVGNQRDRDFMAEVAKRRWHIIIDDCSHDPRIQRSSFDALWSSVHADGWYIIEDCHYSYDPRYKRKGNFVEHVASLVPQIYTDGSVKEVLFYYNLCGIRKGSGS
jgi:hypothetical protein